MRARLPVRLKVAIVSSALTFAILCLFAIVIGAVAEQRIRTGFDDDVRATAADLQDRLQDSITREVSPSSGELSLQVDEGAAPVRGRRRRRGAASWTSAA